MLLSLEEELTYSTSLSSLIYSWIVAQNHNNAIVYILKVLLHPGSNVKICASVLLLLLLLLPLLLGLSLHLSSTTEEPYVILLEAKGEGKVEFTFSVRRMFLDRMQYILVTMTVSVIYRSSILLLVLDSKILLLLL